MPVRLNQWLFERGYSPPWVWNASDCREFWASQDRGATNEPVSYATKSPAIVDLLHDFWSPDITPEMSVLEVGCNAGPNLHRLHQLDYTDLRGAEINPRAISTMRSAFPELDATVIQGALEETLPDLPTDSVDVVFSMAVLIHLHPASRQVFAEMARVARRYVCVVEAESTTVSYIFARNYKRVFERLGLREVRALDITERDHPRVGQDYYGYTARLFAKGRG